MKFFGKLTSPAISCISVLTKFYPWKPLHTIMQVWIPKVNWSCEMEFKWPCWNREWAFYCYCKITINSSQNGFRWVLTFWCIFYVRVGIINSFLYLIQPKDWRIIMRFLEKGEKGTKINTVSWILPVICPVKNHVYSTFLKYCDKVWVCEFWKLWCQMGWNAMKNEIFCFPGRTHT